MKLAESKRIRIRELEDGDMDKFSKLYEDLKTLSLTKQLTNSKIMSAERVMEIFSASTAVYTIETNKRKGKFLGFIFLRKFEEFKLKDYKDPLHINCVILPAYRGKFLGQESVNTFMTYYFKKHPDAIFISKSTLSNVASIRIANRYMQSIPLPNKKDHDCVYFIATAELFFSKLAQQERGNNGK